MALCSLRRPDGSIVPSMVLEDALIITGHSTYWDDREFAESVSYISDQLRSGYSVAVADYLIGPAKNDQNG